jgi:hypothetical protein
MDVARPASACFKRNRANKKPIEMGLPLLGFGLAFDKAK